MKKTLLAFLFSLLFFSCEKDRQSIPENTDIPLISKVLIGDEIYMEYSYDDANLLIEEKSKFHYSRHFYNNNNQLVASDIYWDMRIASSNSIVPDEIAVRNTLVFKNNRFSPYRMIVVIPIIQVSSFPPLRYSFH